MQPAPPQPKPAVTDSRDCCTRMCASLREDLRGWLICLAVLVITVVRSGITYSFGVFVVQLERTYRTPVSEQNWIGTLSFTISLTFAPLSVTLIRCFGENRYRIVGMLGVMILNISCIASSLVWNVEMLFLTHSVLYGVGSSLIYMASSLVIGEYFDATHRHHVLATSILLCGYPIGSLVFNPFNSYIVEQIGWRWAFRIASALILVTGTACCWTFQRNAQGGESGERDQEAAGDDAADKADGDQRQSLLARLLRTGSNAAAAGGTFPRIPLAELRARPEIAVWLLVSLFTYLGFYMPFMNLEFYMSLKGISGTKGSLALVLLSLAECISYIGASFLGDYVKGRLIYCNLFAAVGLGILCVLWPSVDNSYGSILAISLAMGFFLGLTIVYTYAESREITGLPLEVGWAYTNMFSGLGILFSPLAGGFIYDMRHSYDDVFYTVGVIYTITALQCLAIIMLRKFRWSSQAYSEINTNMWTTTNGVGEQGAEQEAGEGVSSWDMTTVDEAQSPNGAAAPVLAAPRMRAVAVSANAVETTRQRIADERDKYDQEFS